MLATAELLTVGVIARRLSVPVHRAHYILRSRKVQPRGKAGHSYVYDESAIELVAKELAEINGPREA